MKATAAAAGRCARSCRQLERRCPAEEVEVEGKEGEVEEEERKEEREEGVFGGGVRGTGHLVPKRWRGEEAASLRGAGAGQPA